ncbi:hypothetical protein EOA25_02875 [Mesorhizobium sp. M2A.F.Ca.ET.040.01.1.1]|nr:hypothetical protein EOA25_02875 [Mesorhizobium sp. M2A.F.Ca.ET.040.01.1.1]
MMSSLQQAEERAAQIAKAMVPVLTAEMIKQGPEPRPLSPRDRAVMEACGKLGRAIDKLDASVNTKWERAARFELECATRALRKLIDLRDPRYGHK